MELLFLYSLWLTKRFARSDKEEKAETTDILKRRNSKGIGKSKADFQIFRRPKNKNSLLTPQKQEIKQSSEHNQNNMPDSVV